MLALMGNELTNGHHRQSLFNDLWQSESDYNSYKGDFDWTLGAIDANGGLSVINHPINIYHTGYPTPYDLADYEALLHDHVSLMGLEVVNSVRFVLDPTGCQYNVEDIWDQLLEDLMPRRQVWGFGTDDNHSRFVHAFYGYTIILMEGLNASDLRNAIENGAMYVCMETEGQTLSNHVPSAATPIINSIAVGDSYIEIDAVNVLEVAGIKQIEWISGYDGVGKISIIVHTGSRLSLDLAGPVNYVRARLVGNAGRYTLTQPFGIG